MTEFDQQRIANWIGDAFAILCVRAAGGSAADRNVRLGFESVLRELGTPPLRLIARSAPPTGRRVATSADWRQIVQALERCRLVFSRYGALLSANQHQIREQVETTLRYAVEELRSRTHAPGAHTNAVRGTPAFARPGLDVALPTSA